MTSSVTSSSRKNQQVACIPDARGSDVVEDPVASYSAISRCYLKIAKRCRLHKLIRQRFALAIKIQQEDVAMEIISRHEDSAGSNITSSRELIYISCCYSSSRKKSRRKESIEEGAKCNSRCVISAAKQLTKGCQLLSSIQNGESDRSLQRKGRKYFYFSEERCTIMERRQDSLLER
ncbi:hypothetical protein F511_45304 [Dorcoceras hygrometricum]|uniref:Uncharacterized protein n=1 Tax=Dorcoceras hygrometricum TaxID=472368 RepID=A0A2Z6ZXJ6_9LAMI|nr:hypothetical protein F511_45304 [Dorcoceras hygrometricum]